MKKIVFLGFVMVVSIAISFGFKGQGTIANLDRIDAFDINRKNEASIITILR